MGKYSSGSESSHSYRKKKIARSRNRSSSRSSSGSKYSSRSKKGKKHRKSKRSRSKERSSKHSKRDRRKSRSSSRSKGKRRRSRSFSRRRSRSTSVSPSVSSSSYSHNRDSSSRDKRRSRSHSNSRHRSRSRSPRHEKKGSIFDGTDLLEKLNKAAVEAMAQNAKMREGKLNIEAQAVRNIIIDDINASDFVQKSFSSEDKNEDNPIVIDTTSIVHKQIEESGSLLHPNLLIEDQQEKLNRWIKKLFLIRQKSLYGEIQID